MSIKPILFNGDMVRAILDGRKTVTRRVIKPQPKENQTHKLGYCVAGDRKNIDKFGFGSDECGGTISWAKVPYWAGDILYVRETWCYGSETIDCLIKKAIEADKTYYRADKIISETVKWHPSIHMPKEAARIWLKVTNVQVKRLQAIDNRGCAQEGIKVSSLEPYFYELYKPRFKNLWNSTVNKTETGSYGWDANPWVWVIEFDRCEKPQEGNHE